MYRQTRLTKPEDMEPFDPGGKPPRFRLRHFVYLTVSILLAGGIIAMAYLLATTTQSADDLALTHEKALVNEALKHQLDLLARDQTFLAVNDRTVKEVESGHIGKTLADTIAAQTWLDFDHDWTLVIGPDNDLMMVAAEDEVVPPSGGREVLLAARDLVTQARQGYFSVRRPAAEGFRVRYVEKGQLAPIYATDVREVAGKPALVSAMAIVPETDALTLPDGAPGVLLSVRLIETRLLASVSQTFLLEDFRYSSSKQSTAANVPVTVNDDAPIGYFEWISAAPGTAIRYAIGPIATAIILAFLLIGYVSARKLAEKSKALEDSEARNRYLALHDTLTGLGNRTYFGDLLDAAMDKCETTPCAVLAIDLDRFKQVNDTFGHDAGDMVIRNVARRLKEVIAGSGIVARTGGDEFLALITGNVDESHLRWLCDTIIEEASKPIPVASGLAHIGVSIGWAIAPKNGDTASLVLCLADQSLYHAKENGRNMAVFVEDLFREDMDAREKAAAEAGKGKRKSA